MLRKIGYIAVFYAIAIAIRFYVVVVHPEFLLELPPIVYGLLSGISPLIGGVVMLFVFKRKMDYRFFSVGKLRTIALILLPIVLFSLSEYIETRTLSYVLPMTILASIIYGFFEEFGWRGYLHSELSEVKPIYKYFIVSLLWYPWHFDFGFDMAHLYSFIFILVGSIGMGYVADKSKSLVLPALFHAFSNLIFRDISFSEDMHASFSATIIIVTVCIVAIIVVMVKAAREQRQLQHPNI